MKKNIFTKMLTRGKSIATHRNGHLMKWMLMVTLILGTYACGANRQNEDKRETRILVTYFSATGNTRQVAQVLAEATHATLYEITPEQPYTDADLNWMDSTSRTVYEMVKHPESRPGVKPFDGDVNRYDVVFVGYPLWWELPPTVVKNFIEHLGLTGQRVIPFATSHSSQAEHSFEILREEYPMLNWQEGKLMHKDDPEETISWGQDAIR